MKRIIRLTERDLTRLVRRVIREASTAPEPVINSGMKPARFVIFFDEGRSTIINSSDKREALDYFKEVIGSSMSTIQRFADEYAGSGVLPKFIKIYAGTSSTGSPDKNRQVANDRVESGIKFVEQAFAELGKETGEVVNQEYIYKFLTTGTNYQYDPTELDKIFDRKKSASKPVERCLYIEVTPLHTMGNKRGRISALADVIETSITTAGGVVINVDEKRIVDAICSCQTYSDITELNTELKRLGGLQSVVNRSITAGITVWGDDYEERGEIRDCLNSASKNSGKGDIAAIAGDKFTLVWR